MYLSGYRQWSNAALDTLSLSLEASTVIALRLAKVTMGGKAARDEISLMLSEKLQSAGELQAEALTGQLGGSPLTSTQHILRHYQEKVSANRIRLT